MTDTARSQSVDALLYPPCDPAATGTLPKGTYEIDVSNQGKQAHNLVVEGPGANKTTPLIQPGGSEKLTVPLKPGDYTLYCSVDDHRKLGMVARLVVG